MAATYEGAATAVPTGIARSFPPGCQMPDPARTGSTGWSRCFIIDTENSAAGGIYVNFLKDQRMLDNDPFQIAFIP
ncbi:hypothetical protein ACQPYH_28725 [Kribbella sp. CA-245084]|uniref:hypothetical protein n=1 Tax=Kribbella sp. CA-245084 TaxID=3239940 RepID=UPI003D950671